MMRRWVLDLRLLRMGAAAGLMVLAASNVAAEEPSEAATAAFNRYRDGVEARLVRQHRSADGFLVRMDATSDARRRSGELVVERLTATGDGEPRGAMLHHWRGTAFVPGAKAADFERVMRDFNAYTRYYAPQVLWAKVIAEQGDRLQASMRVSQKHVITVVMDTSYDVTFGRLDGQHGYSVSRSTRIDEVESAGTKDERVLSAKDAHGFLWRLNTYWSYEERDGGLYLQIETVSLTRGIPRGLGWVVGPFVESVPRESLEFTLRATSEVLRRAHDKQQERT